MSPRVVGLLLGDLLTRPEMGPGIGPEVRCRTPATFSPFIASGWVKEVDDAHDYRRPSRDRPDPCPRRHDGRLRELDDGPPAQAAAYGVPADRRCARGRGPDA